MRPPIFFIHPPKSGGCTVISFFDLLAYFGERDQGIRVERDGSFRLKVIADQRFSKRASILPKWVITF
ncbi:MAG: hypothetical protein CPDRYMAC_2652, partial [uncultured Paraburkholderia sp.]